MLRAPIVEGVTRAQVREAVSILGIDPDDVQSLRISKGVIEVVLFARGPDGKKVAAGDEVATATTLVPVVDDNWDRDELVYSFATATASTVA